MELVYKNHISVEDYNALRAAVGWEPVHPDQAACCLAGQDRVVGCYDGKHPVGCARLIWDGGYIVYLSDVIVHPDYQGHGIGKEMVERFIAFLKSKLQPGWRFKFVMTAAKGKEPFYEKLGFEARPNDHAGAGMELWLRA